MRNIFFKSLILAMILAPADRLPADEEKVYLGLVIHSTNNEYPNQQAAGALRFASSLSAGSITTQILVSGGDDKKQLAGLRAFLSEHGRNAILFVDPSSAANAQAIATLCESIGAYWTSARQRAKGLVPWDFRYYVLHQSVDGVKQGYDIAVRLFKEFKTPGQGRILALQGLRGSDSARERFEGLKKALAEYGDVELLDTAFCDFDPKRAFEATEAWLDKFHAFDGIWSANDEMALAAVEALKARGLNQKIKVAGADGITKALEAIEAGDLVCTATNNGYLEGGYGAAYAYKARKGEINPQKLIKRQRAFYTDGFLVDRDNLADYRRNFIQSPPKYDFNNLKSLIGRPMNLN